MNQTLHSKNCLITGATGGLGKEIAKEFAKKLSGDSNKLIKLCDFIVQRDY